MRFFSASDSSPVAVATMKIYMLRTASLVARGAGRFELGWKATPRGSVDGRRPDDSTPVFCEMATPGTSFDGSWRELTWLAQPEITKALRWREAPTRAALFEAANHHAAGQLAMHRNYAQTAGLALLEQNLAILEGRLEEARTRGGSCLLSIGWGGGFLSKSACLDTDGESFRQVLRQVPLYSRAIQTGLPFPKTRRVVFLNSQPATLPGWALLEVA
jgi:CRISPR-associated protein Csm5